MAKIKSGQNQNLSKLKVVIIKSGDNSQSEKWLKIKSGDKW